MSLICIYIFFSLYIYIIRLSTSIFIDISKCYSYNIPNPMLKWPKPSRSYGSAPRNDNCAWHALCWKNGGLAMFLFRSVKRTCKQFEPCFHNSYVHPCRQNGTNAMLVRVTLGLDSLSNVSSLSILRTINVVKK